MKPANVVIRERRIVLGFSTQEVAASASLSVEEYSDLEAHQEEFGMVLDLRRARLLCRVLGLTPLAALGLVDEFENASVQKEQTLRDARERLGLSVQTLSDDLGMETWVIEELERDEQLIEKWPSQFAVELCARLDLPPRRFLS